MTKKLALWMAMIVFVLPALACGFSIGGGDAPAQPTDAAVRVSTEAPAQVPSTQGATASPLEPTQAPAEPTTAQAAPTLAQPAPTSAPTTAATPAGQRLAQWASTARASSEYNNPDWAAHQATGVPDVVECGDIATAWAARTSDGQEWLEVSFATPVRPVELQIYETYNPGSIVKVELIDTSDQAHTVWEGQPGPVDECPRIFRIATKGVTAAVARARISLDQSVVQDWNEIDAVQLIGDVIPEAASPTAVPGASGVLSQWAAQAIASSEYSTPDWSAQQASGAPDTSGCEDAITAWASMSGEGKDWIELTYDTPVYATEIQIYETYNPGSIIKVEVIDIGGQTHTVWEGQPEIVDACPRVFRIRVSGVSNRVNRIRISLDQSVIQDWNEIDAVQLLGKP